MKKIALFLLFLSFESQADTLFKCAVDRVTANKGVRLNVIRNAAGGLRANLIFGTTVSGIMYSLKEIAPGRYRGTKDKETFWLLLRVSGSEMQNRSIKGFSSDLSVVYPDLNKKTGKAFYETRPTDDFVCGRQIATFR